MKSASFSIGFPKSEPWSSPESEVQIGLMEEALKLQIGVAVREARKRAQLTQEELAERVGKSTEAISNIERGRALPALTTLLELARALNEPLQYLVSDLPEGTPKAMKRLSLELQLRNIIDQFDDKFLEVAIGQLKLLADLRR